jgi:integral membrane protein
VTGVSSLSRCELGAAPGGWHDRGVQPRALFRLLARAEAVTWALLLAGMFLKYVTETTEVGVRVFGMAHGVVFVAYCLVVVTVAVDHRWSPGRTLLGLVAAVPPFLTLWFERYADRRDAVEGRWRLSGSEPRTPLERPVAWLVRNPLVGAGVGAVAVASLTAAALVVGPPTG